MLSRVHRSQLGSNAMQYGSRGNTIDNDPLLYHSVQTREKTIIGGAESGQKAATYCARIQPSSQARQVESKAYAHHKEGRGSTSSSVQCQVGRKRYCSQSITTPCSSTNSKIDCAPQLNNDAAVVERVTSPLEPLRGPCPCRAPLTESRPPIPGRCVSYHPPGKLQVAKPIQSHS